MRRIEAVKFADVETLLLPTSYIRSFELARKRIGEIKPIYVLSFGQAEGRSEISLEYMAINVAHRDMHDNDGHMRTRERLIAKAPEAYVATIPVYDLREWLAENGISAKVSFSAGTYVCNSLFFHPSVALST